MSRSVQSGENVCYICGGSEVRRWVAECPVAERAAGEKCRRGISQSEKAGFFEIERVIGVAVAVLAFPWLSVC